jgi:ribosome biogenesis GTPase
MNKDQGLIYKSTGSWYLMLDSEGQMWQARVRGKLRIDKEIASSNPLAVGDIVVFEVEDEATKTAIIKNVSKRKNYIVRVSPHNRFQKHILASNLDAAVLIATLAEPRTSNGFIDRFLITAEAYHIPVIVVANKIDLHKAEQEAQLAQWRQQYEAAGYEFFALSARDPEGLRPLQERIAGHTTLFSGHSGVGKSTLINALIPDLDLRTAEVSDWSGKGQHTTTFAEMFDLPELLGGGRIIDTPGVKEFGLIDMEREELSHYFPEMRALMHDCRFNNCLHIDEPGCAVKAAVLGGTMSASRYSSYQNIFESIEKKW